MAAKKSSTVKPSVEASTLYMIASVHHGLRSRIEPALKQQAQGVERMRALERELLNDLPKPPLPRSATPSPRCAPRCAAKGRNFSDGSGSWSRTRVAFCSQVSSGVDREAPGDVREPPQSALDSAGHVHQVD